jgi:hypothetical protein
VTLVRARGLGGWQGEADPYVTLSLMDSAGEPGFQGSSWAGVETTMEFEPGTVGGGEGARGVGLTALGLLMVAALCVACCQYVQGFQPNAMTLSDPM